MRRLTKKELKTITDSEAARINEILTGSTVVANMRKGKDTVLIAWAKRNDIFVRIDRQTQYGNKFDMKNRSRGQAVSLYRSDLLDIEHDIIEDT